TVTIVPQDDDEDGMPDEWELQHDLDITQNDAFNDPDGDGLPNLAEYKLDTCPNRADNPLHLENIATNQTFREYGFIPVPLKSYIDKQPISLVINSNRADARFTQRADGNWYINWDTGFLTNGNYSIALEFQYNPDAQPPNQSSITGNTKSVTVANDVTFSQLASSFSGFLVIDVQLALQEAEWRIEIFDEVNQPLGFFEGTTTNGLIQFSWDLTDGNGNQVAFSHIRTDFYTQPIGLATLGGNTKKAKRWFIKEVPGGIGDAFVVAWGWDEYGSAFNNARENLMLDGVINIIGNPGRSDEYRLRPGRNIPFASAFRYDSEADRELLVGSLKSRDTGNFFWFGHGSKILFYGNGKKSFISPDDIEGELQNRKSRSTPKVPTENKHPYRLVILNGCNTYNADWANAFGIDFSPKGTTNDVVAYSQHGRQSQAFVGWTEAVRVPRMLNPNFFNANYAEGLANLFSAWMDGFALEECLRRYVERMNHYNFGGHDSWKISGTAYMYRGAP
ncbi:MAG: hypothetical protein ACR2H1_02950, partial [Limisphaerales bacterium]